MRQDRKEQLKINKMKYRAKPEVKQRIKFQMNKYNGEKVKCECGKIMNRGSLTRHKKRKEHLKWLSEQDSMNKSFDPIKPKSNT